MKQAILILSGSEKDKLPFLVKQFDNRFNIYIHIDRKFDVTQDFIYDLMIQKNVKHISHLYETNWGSMNIVRATLHLCKEALSNKQNSHFHLISAADFPIVSNDYICEKFKSDKDNYIDYFKMPHPEWNNGGYTRLMFYHPLDFIDIRKPDEQTKYYNFINYQKTLGIRRPLLNIPYYGGSTWWSLSRKCISYIINNLYNYNIYISMHDTWVPDEIFIQTLLLNSPIRTNLINNNLRFIVWKQKNGNCPANLDINDFNDIIKSNCIFMRKVDKECSLELVKKISRMRNNNIKTISKYDLQ